MVIEKAVESDLEEILALQKVAYISEAEICNDYRIQPLTQSFEDIKEEYKSRVFLKVIIEGRIVGSVRVYQQEDTCYVGKLIVHPEFQNKGIGTALLKAAESNSSDCKRYELFTSKKSIKNIYLYNRLGYQIYKELEVSENLTVVYLEKIREKE